MSTRSRRDNKSPNREPWAPIEDAPDPYGAMLDDAWNQWQRWLESLPSPQQLGCTAPGCRCIDPCEAYIGPEEPACVLCWASEGVHDRCTGMCRIGV